MVFQVLRGADDDETEDAFKGLTVREIIDYVIILNLGAPGFLCAVNKIQSNEELDYLLLKAAEAGLLEYVKKVINERNDNTASTQDSKEE